MENEEISDRNSKLVFIKIRDLCVLICQTRRVWESYYNLQIPFNSPIALFITVGLILMININLLFGCWQISSLQEPCHHIRFISIATIHMNLTAYDTFDNELLKKITQKQSGTSTLNLWLIVQSIPVILVKSRSEFFLELRLEVKSPAKRFTV